MPEPSTKARESTITPSPPSIAERPVGLVRGTRDWLPGDHARLLDLEHRLFEQFHRAGYQPMKTPILEFSELHERKSGAGIVSKLFEVPGAGTASICLRPELTASIVRAYTEAKDVPALPSRVSMSGPVFRFQKPGVARDREFTQVGVELLGTGGPTADAEVIWLADWSLRAVGIHDATIRIGHVGLILELLDRCGLPPAVITALVESLSEAAAEGDGVGILESALDRLTDWLKTDEAIEEPVPSTVSGEGSSVDRLFRHLVPQVTGRRQGDEIIGRLKRKWELSHSLHEVLARARDQVHALATLHGPAPEVLERLDRDFAKAAPDSTAAIRSLVAMLGHHGIDRDRIILDLGFGRGIGFYTQMIFELIVPTPDGEIEVCGGGRYDGLARVLGSSRDDRGAGFAFGLERLLFVLAARSAGHEIEPPIATGYLVTSNRQGESLASTIDVATFLRERINVPVIVSDLAFDEAVEQAKGLRLAQVVTVGETIELWNLEHGDVRSVREGELIEQMRTRLAVFKGDR